MEQGASLLLWHSTLFCSTIYLCFFHVGVQEERRANLPKDTLKNKGKDESKQLHTTGIGTDFRACPLKSWFSTSFLCNMDFFDEIQAT